MSAVTQRREALSMPGAPSLPGAPSYATLPPKPPLPNQTEEDASEPQRGSTYSLTLQLKCVEPEIVKYAHAKERSKDADNRSGSAAHISHHSVGDWNIQVAISPAR